MTPTSGVWPAKSELDEIMRPTIMKLEEDYVTHIYFVDEFPAFLDAFKVINPQDPINNSDWRTLHSTLSGGVK
ncbi:hypothetical protein sscle_15g103440 [Sclerotinia sclerotiorum 1980 UF-70]|uniref:Uncharacterized protein n=1 Tax=Sclerotinia sclerotiorum (strain ATCC 18683 / 1980 / Ss-1) TaxID=665079 RepID=A0A1D9QKW0_SCLS1|nr:hypothetical protein sscle_15g103440 [Sclerotinia sclerotiorum 1980 UF-70]